MIIANPIYDTVFKRLMENRRIARFFVETIIGEQVEEIAMMPQEYTYYSSKVKDDQQKVEQTNPKEKWITLSLICFDFVATIRTADGEYKKVFEITGGRLSITISTVALGVILTNFAGPPCREIVKNLHCAAALVATNPSKGT